MSGLYGTDQFREYMTSIGRLPQAGVLKTSNVHKWVERTLFVDGPRIKWHIARAGGFGGSEAGTLVSWAFKEFHARNTVDRLIKNKLLILPPDMSNADTARGSYLERFVEKVFTETLTRNGHTFKQRRDIMALVQKGPHPQYPWLRASLDGVYEIDGKIYIIDFKAPSQDTLASYVKYQDFNDYIAQLNHYKLVAEGRKVHIDGMKLAMLDYKNIATIGCHIFDIENSPTMKKQIIEVSSHLWNEYVLKGLVPESEKAPIVKMETGVPKELEKIARETVMYKLVAEEATMKYEEGRETIGRWVQHVGKVGNGVLKLARADGVNEFDGYLNIKSKGLNLEHAELRLKELGYTDEQLDAMREPGKYEASKLPENYKEAFGTMEDIAEYIKDGIEISDIERLLKEKIEKLQKFKISKGPLIPELVIKALEDCNEVVDNLITENITASLPRGNKLLELDERKEILFNGLHQLVHEETNWTNGVKVNVVRNKP
jgi:predicted phage-related endonuclease